MNMLIWVALGVTIFFVAYNIGWKNATDKSLEIWEVNFKNESKQQKTNDILLKRPKIGDTRVVAIIKFDKKANKYEQWYRVEEFDYPGSKYWMLPNDWYSVAVYRKKKSAIAHIEKLHELQRNKAALIPDGTVLDLKKEKK